MDILYLDSTLDDFEWMSYYYSEIFPQGWANMSKHLKATEQILSQNPFIGRAYDDSKTARQINIHRTPFSLIYRVSDMHIQVLRVWDMRRDNSKMRFD